MTFRDEYLGEFPRDECFGEAVGLWQKYYRETELFDTAHPHPSQHGLRNKNAREALRTLDREARAWGISNETLSKAKKYVSRGCDHHASTI